MDKNKVNSYNVEFGYELISALPYAYKLYLEERLKETESGVDTKCLYYFSKKHIENNKLRHWDNMQDAWKNNLPNINIHRADLDWESFVPPPLKKHYKNNRFKFKKPIVCICNRVNIEWKREVINYFDTHTLKVLFNLLKNDYQIIYFNINGKQDYYDGVSPVDIGDYKLIYKEFPEVINIHDLHKKNADLTFNTLQLMVMANCDKFITMNGGYGILASYFGGTNIIYSKECKEIRNIENAFNRWYNKFGNSRIIHVNNYISLMEKVNNVFIKKIPLINILIRTCNRPNYFRDCMLSITKQTYRNIRVIVGVDNEYSNEYIIPYNVNHVRYNTINEDKIPESPKGIEYGIKFPYNEYLNILNSHVQEGWIMYLDDDDMLLSDTAIEEIMNYATSEDDLLLWRVKFPGRLIPSDENFGHSPVCRDISGIGFMFHSKHIKHAKWNLYKRADYVIINKLYNILNPVWINKAFTSVQRESGEGMGKRQDKQMQEDIILIINNNLINNMKKSVVVLKSMYKGHFFGNKGEELLLEESTANALIAKGLVKDINEVSKLSETTSQTDSSTTSQTDSTEVIKSEIISGTKTETNYQEKEEKKEIENKEFKTKIENKDIKPKAKSKGRKPKAK